MRQPRRRSGVRAKPAAALRLEPPAASRAAGGRPNAAGTSRPRRQLSTASATFAAAAGRRSASYVARSRAASEPDPRLAALLDREAELVQFFKDEGLKVYEPDQDAFREYAQQKYLESEFAASWPDGMLDAINALAD